MEVDLLTKLKMKEYDLVHTGKPDIFKSAEAVNKSYNYLCRISNLNEDLPFPIEIAVPLMKLKKNYKLLELIANECGFALVKLPRVATAKGEENEIVSEYQTEVSEAIRTLIKFFAEKDQGNGDQAEEKLNTVVKRSLSIVKYIKKVLKGQLSLFNH